MSFFKTLFGGGSSKGPPFDEFVEAGMEGLRLQSAAHQETWGFGEEERWDFDQDSGDLVFTFGEVQILNEPQADC